MKTVWKVTGYDIDCPSETLFEAYFSDRDTAIAAQRRGQELGHVGMRWLLEVFDVDNHKHLDAMFDYVREG